MLVDIELLRVLCVGRVGREGGSGKVGQWEGRGAGRGTSGQRGADDSLVETLAIEAATDEVKRGRRWN